MRDGVFICYRRADTAADAGRLHERLVIKLGAHRVFKDVFGIDPGEQIDEAIRAGLGRASVVLVLIGPQWPTQRLFEQRDYVRREIEIAFEQGIKVVPVLVGDATMPEPSLLPESIQRITALNAARLRHDPDFAHDVKALLRSLPAQRAWLFRLGAAVALISVTGLVVALFPSKQPGGGGTPPLVCSDGMIEIPEATFWMGSPSGVGHDDEHPDHKVTLSRYCIDKTEVTVADYARCVAKGDCAPAPLTVSYDGWSAEQRAQWSSFCNRPDRPDHPINCVDWDQAAAYCAAAGKQLPTEAQWEYAARGRDGRTYPWGNEPPAANRLNVCASECTAIGNRDPKRAMFPESDGFTETAPVGSYPDGASPFGALDMGGNVWEWTADWYRAYNGDAQTDPRGPSTGETRVYRGGGWIVTEPAYVRTMNRGHYAKTLRTPYLGFRCAKRR